jgi:hypothetical protein
MRRFLFTLFWTALAVVFTGAAEGQPRAASPEEVEVLKQAMRNSRQDTEHWAYTESTILKLRGDTAGKETVVRFDPSKPYEEQYTPLKVEGREPAAKDRKKYRAKGEKRHRDLQGKGDPSHQRGEGDFVIGSGNARLDPDHPRVLEADAERVVFEIPLIANRRGVPVDKFQIVVRVDAKSRLLESASLRVREAFRMKLVAKLKEGEARMDFAVIDPQFGPVIAAVNGDFGGSFMLIPLKGTFASTRTDWQRVKAFDEGFNVKLAPLQFPGFRGDAVD